MMAGKRCVFASDGVFSAMDCLSKNQLIDLAVDLCCAEIGEDATDEAILEWMQAKFAAVWRARNDRSVDLMAKLVQRRRVVESYQKQGLM